MHGHRLVGTYGSSGTSYIVHRTSYIRTSYVRARLGPGRARHVAGHPSVHSLECTGVVERGLLAATDAAAAAKDAVAEDAASYGDAARTPVGGDPCR